MPLKSSSTSRRLRRFRAGVTLLEMMTGVAILGVMTAMAGTGFQRVVAMARENGSAASLSRAVANARIRALAMRCGISVQLNGPRYFVGGGTPPVPGFPREPMNIAVFLKNNCNSPNGFFEAGDRILETISLADNLNASGKNNVVATLPLTLATSGPMDRNALLISFGFDASGSFTRSVYTDVGYASFNPSTVGDFNVSFSSGSDSTHQRSAVIPFTGVPHLD